MLPQMSFNKGERVQVLHNGTIYRAKVIETCEVGGEVCALLMVNVSTMLVAHADGAPEPPPKPPPKPSETPPSPPPPPKQHVTEKRSVANETEYDDDATTVSDESDYAESVHITVTGFMLGADERRDECMGVVGDVAQAPCSSPTNDETKAWELQEMRRKSKNRAGVRSAQRGVAAGLSRTS